ncbi:MAG: fumarylacetoacetate hydrolase family protein [Treponema sp.]|jgi:2-keto-4-pentenoate hydratase/2-oxohepta-3-ene-1,7-dioic acid hydratase in catechol pathway|nr:fumarylacetoacetate hydrolase family protein [Treponema sp.]
MITLPVTGEPGRVITLNPSKIIAVGLNYRAHVRESLTFGTKSLDEPKEPVLFAKTPNVLIGSGESIVIPRLIDDYGFEEPRTDPEGELAVIIGKGGRHIREENALDHVLGYTCFNDVSQRNIQKADPSGWFRGKSFDTFGPAGPAAALRGSIDPGKLGILTRINGRIVQSGNTRDMIFSVPRLIAYISKQFTLEPGDLIATGTPAGISPVKPGDTVEVEIEGIGILRNPVIREPHGDR